MSQSTGTFWDTPRLATSTDRRNWENASRRLEQISRDVDPEIAMYFMSWASDAAIGIGDLPRAIGLSPVPKIGARQSIQADNRLSLKLAIDLPVDARDITALFGPKVTAFGRKNIEAIELHLQLQIDGLAQAGTPLRLGAWIADAYQNAAGYTLFSGQPVHVTTTPPVGWHFSLSPTAQTCCITMIREAENTWREDCELPRVGEGWVAETQLYYALKTAFPALDVLQHYRPEWLGRQHLDVAMPQIRVAVEYQGAQHDQPIAFFGGEEAFARTVERDRRKLHKCRRQGWRLIYVRDGYDLVGLLNEITAST